MTHLWSLGALAALFGGPALVAACTGGGGDVAIASSGGAAVGVPPSGAPTPGLPPSGPGTASPCPGYDPPLVGDVCFHWVEACEYGHDLDRRCNDVFSCGEDSRWEQGARSACFGRCPDTFAAIEPGSPCNDSTVGCSYFEGTCACIPDPDAGTPDPDADDDAGPSSVPGRWRCMPPPGKGCPAQRPSIGSDCVNAMDCDYGSCALGRELVYSCIKERWVQGDYPASCE